jgi:hypothetical protein
MFMSLSRLILLLAALGVAPAAHADSLSPLADNADIYSRTGVGEGMPAPVAPVAAVPLVASAPTPTPATTIMRSTPGAGSSLTEQNFTFVAAGNRTATTVAAATTSTFSPAFSPSFGNDPERTGVGEYTPPSQTSSPTFTSATAPISLTPVSQPTFRNPSRPQASSYSFTPRAKPWTSNAINVIAPAAEPTGMKPVTAGGFTFVPRPNYGRRVDDRAIANGYPKNVYDGAIAPDHPQRYWYNDMAAREAGRRGG